ncbi:MAG: thymidine kinase [Anaerolineae bacterium]|nr:thymidine kinase [Anaerolineae bacterium]MCO5192615.1 thymidine kinase [Anaerolineae bacterium]MCO5199161.1 thymidine kinase [Anaerolineae bacterium]
MTLHHSGRIEMICGSMFSGKTEELIRRTRRAVIARQKVQVFKPAIDIRFAEQKVVSHNGVDYGAIPVISAESIFTLLDPDTTVVAIDEVQFFDPAVVAVCERLADDGKRVICAGLDLDFRGLPFGPMPELLARAETVDKLHAICVICAEPATRTQRLIDGQPAAYDDPVVLIGAAEVYEARCRDCHTVRSRESQRELPL